MFILVFSGVVALVELCVLGLHESHRNQEELSAADRRLQRYCHHLRGNIHQPVETVFPLPAMVGPRETLETLALLQNSRSARLSCDHWDRLM
ncbi:MAG: hypothetical protein V4719_01605 [Planctomycetota bacterium]